MNSQEQKTVVLGPEYDQRLRRAVFDVLVRMGASPQSHDWGLAGSQEVETVEVRIGADRLLLESETFLGLSLTGPANLVHRIEAMVKSEMSKSLT